MQVSVENTGTLGRRLQVAIPAERIDREIADRLKRIGRTARLNGFRPGKAPMNVIRQQFGAQVKREVIGDLLHSSFAEAVSEQQLHPAGNPQIEPQAMGEGEGLRYVATFEVFPEITLTPVDSLEIQRTVAEVATDDVDAMIDRLRSERPVFSAVERPAMDTDRVWVDFEGRVDGAPFAGGKGENVAIILGQKRMLPEIEQGLVGTRAGEHREVELTFPADYRATELAGKPAVFSVQVKSVESATKPELDEAFFKSLGVESGGLEKLKADVLDNLNRELAQNLRARTRQAVLDALLEANSVELPGSLIESQVQEMQVEAMRRAGIQDVSKAPAREPFVEPARRRVAMGLILSELIKQHQLVLDQGRVTERLQEMASSYADPQALINAYRNNAGALRQIENLVLEDQVVDHVLSHARVHEVKSTFKDVMNFG
ncbi:MAG: trigger factor [Proteobacteria bacterium]|nr:trigger factor [Pseudomonadota bacterium]